MEQLCWYCKKNIADSSPKKVYLYKETLKIPTSTTSTVRHYTNAVIYIPRCYECKKKHKRMKFISVFGLILGMILVSPFIAEFVFRSNSTLSMLISLTLGATLGALLLRKLVGKKILKDTIDELKYVDFPVIKQKLENGWKVDNRFHWN